MTRRLDDTETDSKVKTITNRFKHRQRRSTEKLNPRCYYDDRLQNCSFDALARDEEPHHVYQVWLQRLGASEASVQITLQHTGKVITVQSPVTSFKTVGKAGGRTGGRGSGVHKKSRLTEERYGGKQMTSTNSHTLNTIYPQSTLHPRPQASCPNSLEVSPAEEAWTV